MSVAGRSSGARGDRAGLRCRASLLLLPPLRAQAAGHPVGGRSPRRSMRCHVRVSELCRPTWSMNSVTASFAARERVTTSQSSVVAADRPRTRAHRAPKAVPDSWQDPSRGDRDSSRARSARRRDCSMLSRTSSRRRPLRPSTTASSADRSEAISMLRASAMTDGTRRIAHRRQVDECHAIGRTDCPPGGLDREARLTDTARAGDCDKPLLLEQPRQARELLLATEMRETGAGRAAVR